MESLEFFNNYSDSVCAFSKDKKIVFKNKSFLFSFPDCVSLEKFKKRFNFNLCFLSPENIKKTPIDLLLNSKENFHTICTYQNLNDEYLNYYLYTYKYKDFIIAIFKDITTNEKMSNIQKKYSELKSKYDEMKEASEKFSKTQEQVQTQVLFLTYLKLRTLLKCNNNMS